MFKTQRNWRVMGFVLALLIVVMDWVSKTWALAHLSDNMIVINSWFNLNLAFNHGAAFSFLAGAGGWQRWALGGFALLVSVWLAYSLVKEKMPALVCLAYGAILGGSVGNLYDRIVYGYVIDFIQWHYQGRAFPTFNIADCGITIGVGLLFIAWFVLPEERQ